MPVQISANLPWSSPPAWAVLERRLIDALNDSVQPFLQKYTHPDGSLIWRDTWRNGRDGADDIYESFYNWPLLYLLGGSADLLPLSHRQWEAMTRQLTRMGPVYKEYERGYDHFHQSEGYLYFYFLCMADPASPRLGELARRFAGFYLNEDPEAPNYDPEKRLIRAPHNGSAGPRWGTSDGAEPSYGWNSVMRRYGLPFDDVPGIRDYDDLKDPVLARRMGAVMEERMGKGDTATNLMATSLITNAYLLTGEAKYRRWVLEYVDAWIERARRNGDLLPDNIGLSGAIGEYNGGKWWGGLYGWTWPHGFYNIGMAALVAGTNAFLLSRDPAYLDFPRSQIDAILDLAEERSLDDPSDFAATYREEMRHFAPFHRDTLLVVPYRRGDSGWFEYQPMHAYYPVTQWYVSMDPADWARIERLRAGSPYDWRTVAPFRDKHDSGHEGPWLRFLAGENPAYPEEILSQSLGQVARRMEVIRQDDSDLTQAGEHHWQLRNPVLTEALIQLTLGAPQVIYNGGLLFSRLRYFDAAERRPGLPADVAALVEKVEPERVVVRLVNLSVLHTRSLLLQAGAFREHRFRSARWSERSSDFPGAPSYYAPPLQTGEKSLAVEDSVLGVELPPGCEICLELGMELNVQPPTYTLPW